MPGLDTAAAGIDTFNVSLVHLATSILQTCTIIAAMTIMTQIGGQGIQKPVRATGLTIGVCAMFLKLYDTLTTGAIGLF